MTRKSLDRKAAIPSKVVYRSLYQADLHFLRDGKFRLTLLSEMAKKELGPLSDPMEGRVVREARGPVQVRYGSGSAEERNIQRFVGAPDGTTLTFEDCSFESSCEDWWILCFSTRIDTPIFLERYDSTVRVTDVVRLANRIRVAAKGALGTPILGLVSYFPRTHDVRASLPGPHPFVKDPKFKPELEFRVAWKPLLQTPESGVLDICAPSTIPLMQIVRPPGLNWRNI